MARSRHSQATAADAHGQRARLRRGPGRVEVGRAQHRPTTLVVPASLLLLTRYGLERGPPPEVRSPRAAQRTACSAAQYHSAHACQRAPCTGCNGPSCNMQPGMMRPAIRRQRKLQHTRARAHTEEHTPAHAHSHTHTHTRACTHSRVQTHTRTLMCAHRHTDTQKQIHTQTRAATALAQLRAGVSRNPRRR